ncbi:MAG: siderophore-interacting protein [Propionibacteriaceae bacterium]|nr:siderophore-interacting protein [Propionibacteriaceae bacterium]
MDLTHRPQTNDSVLVPLLRRPRVRDHLVEVVAVEDLTDWYRRVTIDPKGLFDIFTPEPAGYLMLNLPSLDQASLVQRSYTMRSATPESCWLEFVLHTPEGPASRWAASATPGTTLSVSEPPYHLSIPETTQGLLIADASAFAAAACLIQSCDPAMAVTVLLQDGHPDRESIPLPTRDNTSVSWIDSLDQATLESVVAGLDPADCFLWAAGERSLAKTVREFARTSFLVPRPAQHIQTYWIEQ